MLRERAEQAEQGRWEAEERAEAEAQRAEAEAQRVETEACGERKAEQGKWEAEENAEAEIRKRQRSECGDLAVISDLGMETRAPIPEEPPTRRMPAVLWGAHHKLCLAQYRKRSNATPLPARRLVQTYLCPERGQLIIRLIESTQLSLPDGLHACFTAAFRSRQ